MKNNIVVLFLLLCIFWVYFYSYPYSCSVTVELKNFWKDSLEPVDKQKRRETNYPFVTGDEFRKMADFVFDETSPTFSTDNVTDGAIIFVRNQKAFLDCFFENIHPHIKVRYILITHNGLMKHPGTPHLHGNLEDYVQYLNEDKLIAWFGKNLTLNHKKAYAVPLGIQNRYVRGLGDYKDIISQMPIKKRIFLYMNFNLWTYPERKEVMKLFYKKQFCYASGRVSFKDYFHDLASSVFVLSPRGAGIDCHRTWESIIAGSIPLVGSSGLDMFFEDLPVIIVKDWSSVTKEYLNRKQKEILWKLSTGKYNFEKLYADYWIDKIKSVQKKMVTVER